VTAPPDVDAKRAGRGKVEKKQETTVGPKRRPRRIDWPKKP
jgi:hypothetical protein